MSKNQYSATAPSPADGSSIEPQCDSRGNVKVALFDQAGTSGLTISTTGADGLSASSNAALTKSFMYGFNGSTTDKWRNNVDATVLASAARTTTTNSTDQTNYNGRGLHLVIDVTAIAATPSVVFTIQGKDPLSGQYYTILASAAVTAVSTVVLRVYPGLTAAANLVASDILPRTWRVNCAHGDADSITYSVAASVIL